ncbi:DUF4365 domain-containing protein [Streptomyces sp. NPDC093252]|uniref:DUF4365 domain-containing protein n=1 Tax=Streptomyces sp. NPDC093252 TaxID=3154980 RepID=UPI003446EBE1
MPERPNSHVVASRAVAAVTDIWAQTGAAVEEVKNDYGEDLMIQTSWKGNVDESRIWVQVKGKSSLGISRKTGAPKALTVPKGHALRWQNIADTVVIVVWDIESRKGWYALPQEQLDRAALLMSETQSVTIRFNANNQFTQASAESLTWHSRFRHADREVANVRAAVEFWKTPENSSNANLQYQQLIARCFEFLQMLEIFSDDGPLLPEYEMGLRRCYQEFRGAPDFPTPERAFDGGAHMVILAAADKISMGVPVRLLAELAGAIQVLYISMYGDLNKWFYSPPQAG